MTVISLIALSFVVWWIVLFAALPFGLRTQEENGEVVPGTVASAPGRPHMGKALIRTTIVTIIIMALFYGVTRGLGLTIDDLPIFIPIRD
ncbi:DUF1467 family protein [Mesorhizobium sp. SB112]|uniref:DUF1467 family protein n=1 Tax=Mesorhizobium sp. SB112 TaxID=3151853 RepID=UPI003267C11F